MKFVLFLFLLLAPCAAMGQSTDPIAHACYFCTEPEMRQKAAGLGDGVHYIYDFDLLYITGYTVAMVAGRPQATRFEAEDWVKRQFLSLVEHFSPTRGVIKHFTGLYLYAPGSDHGNRAGQAQYIEGHQLSALHPQSAQARETIVRYLERHGDFGFLDGRDSGGRLLQLQVMSERGYPVSAELGFRNEFGMHARFDFDYALREWKFVEAFDVPYRIRIQHSAADFLVGGQSTYYNYSGMQRWYADGFADRARWAGVPVTGTVPGYGKDVTFLCQGTSHGQVECAYQ